MHLINALIFLILTNLDSIDTFSNSPIEISLPFSPEKLYPYLISYNGKEYLFSSKGVYYIKSNASQYYLQIAYPEFFTDFTINKYTSDFFYVEIDRATKMLIFPFYNDCIYFKIYSRKTTFYLKLNHSYKFLSGNRPEVQQIDNEHFILSAVEADTRLGIFIVFNKDRQIEIEEKTSFQINIDTFSCAYFPFTDRYFCLFSKGYDKLFYVRYIPGTGLSSVTLLVTTKNTSTSHIKIHSTGVRMNVGSLLGTSKHEIILFHFTVGIERLLYIDSRNTQVSADDPSDHFVLLLGNKYLIVAGYFNELYQCKFYMNNLGFHSLTLSGLDLCGDNGYQMRIATSGNFLNFVYVKKDSNTLALYQHPFIDCTEIYIKITNNKEVVYLDVNEITDMNKYKDDDYSGIYLSANDTFTEAERGKFSEVDKDGNEIGEFIFRDRERFYKRIKYQPIYPQLELYYYIIFFRVTDSFFIQSPSCLLTIQGNCYSSCNDCSKIGNETDHQCSVCKENFYFKENTTNCYSGTIANYYFDNENYLYKECSSNCLVCSDANTCTQCEEGYALRSQFTNNPNEAYCIKSSNHYYYIDEENNIIFMESKEKCPTKYPCLNEETNQCFSSNEMSQRDCNIMLLSNKTIKEIEEYIEENAVNLYNEEYSHTRYENSFLIYDSFNTTGKGLLTELSLEGCEDKIREQYSIKEEDYFLIGHVEYFDERDVYYYIYLQNGTSIDMSICEDTSLVISQDIYDEDLTLDKEKIVELYKKKIDVFDISAPFFNDKCNSFSDNKRDVPLMDRRVVYYQNITSIKEHCEYKKIDTDSFRMILKCNLTESNINKNILSLTGRNSNPSASSISESAFDLLRCIDRYALSSFFSNFGSVFMLIILFIQTILLIVYLCQINKLIKEYIDSEREIGVESKDSTEEINKRNESNIFIYEKSIIRNLNKINKTDLSTLTYSGSFSEESSKTKEKIIDFDRLDFSNAILYDKRNFLSIFISRLKMFNSLCVICTNQHNKIKTIVLSSSLFLLSLCIFFNAFLYRNKYISYIYYNGYYFSTEIKKYLLSSFLSIFIKVLIELGLVNHFPKRKEIKDLTEKAEYISRMKKCNCVMFILILISSLFFWLYVTLFCILYSSTQQYLFFGSLFSFVLNIMFSIFAALLCSVLRVMALKGNHEILFDVETFIDIC